MKILQVIPVFYPAQVFGGAANVVYQTSKELARRGHEVKVYTTNALDQKRNFRLNCQEHMLDGFKVRYFTNAFRPHGLYVTPGIIFALRKEITTFDVIHIHAWRQFWQDIITHHYAVKYKVPYLLQVHGGLPRINTRQNVKLIYDQFFGYRLLRDASKVVALTQTEAKQYHEFGVPENKIDIVPNGIGLSEFACLPPKGSFKKKFNLSEKEQIVLYLGRIHRAKGIEFLVRAFTCLAKVYNGNLRLVIAGPDDGYLEEVVSLVNSLGISESVLFTELLSVEDKISAYVDANIVVNVEPRNVFGLVPLESAACATPVIVSKDNAISEIIKEGEFGFSVEYGDIRELTSAITKLLSDNNLSSEMGQNGRRFVYRNFDWANIIVKIEDAYKDVAKSGR